MQSTIIHTAETLFNEGKKSLDTLLREKSYEEVAEKLNEAGVDINTVADEDVEVLIAARVEEKKNGIKGFATGAVLALLISAIVGA
jgi:transaldolase